MILDVPAPPIVGRTAGEIAESVRELAERGQLTAGDPLPSVRALADALGINRNTVVAAYRQLAQAGIVESRGRAGTRLAAVRRMPQEGFAAGSVLRDVGTGNPDPARLSAELRGAVLGVRDGAEVVIAAMSQPHARVQGTIEARFTASVQAAVGEAASASNVRIVGQALLHLTLGSAAVHQSAAQLAQATGPAGTDSADGDVAASEAEHAAAVRFLLDGLEHIG